MIVKIHKASNGKKIVAICDSNLIGKKFEEKNLQLDLSSNFYKGEERAEEEILNIIKGAYIINLVGEKSIKLALKANVIDKKSIIKIKKIPHAQVVIVTE